MFSNTVLDKPGLASPALLIIDPVDGPVIGWLGEQVQQAVLEGAQVGENEGGRHLLHDGFICLDASMVPDEAAGVFLCHTLGTTLSDKLSDPDQVGAPALAACSNKLNRWF